MRDLADLPTMARSINETLIEAYDFNGISGAFNVTASTVAAGNLSLSTTVTTTAELINHYVGLIYTPILVLTGTIGNILSVFVFFKTKLKKLSSSYYLAALAVSDTCFLFNLLISWLSFSGYDIYNWNIYCQFFTFLGFLCSFLSAWFVVAFTVERFIAVMYPLKRQSMCTVRRAKFVLCGLTIAGCIHSAPIFYFASPVFIVKMDQTICDIHPPYKNQMKIFNYLDFTLVLIVPFTTIVVLNTFIGCTVWKFATVRRTMTTHKRKSQTTRTFSPNGSTRNNLRKQSTLSSGCSHPNGNNSITNTTISKSSRRKITNSSQIKVTKMLLIVSTVFICLNLPSYLMRIRAFLEPDSDKSAVSIQYICWFFFITNFGINFVLYCVSGQNFRRAVVSMFRKVSASNLREGTTQVTVSEYIRNSGTTASRRRTCNPNGSWNDVHELRQIISVK